MTISELVEQAHANAKEKGFWDKPRETGTMIALIHSEVSEALEAEDCAGFCEELADICIRIFDLCGAKGINLEFEVSMLDYWTHGDIEGELVADSLETLEKSFRRMPQEINKFAKSDSGKSMDAIGHFLKAQDERHACNVHKVLSKALEQDRKGDKHGFEVALTMAFLFTLQWAAQKGYSIERAIAEKMARNRERPRMHGKAY
jgi:NTP pyrophosphatase (non-canonical NTP hydrolase)